MKLQALGIVYVNQKLYVASSDFNGLFSVDVNTWKVDFLTRFNECPKNKRLMFNKVIMVGNKLYFMPHLSDFMGIYNLETGKTENINIGTKSEIISDAYVIDGNLWLFMMSYPCPVLKVDLETLSVERYMMKWDSVFEETGMTEDSLDSDMRDYTILKMVLQEKRCWMIPHKMKGILLTYDINGKDFSSIKLNGLENEEISSVEIVDNDLWISIAYKNVLVKWNRFTQKMEWICYEGSKNSELWTITVHIGDYIVVVRDKELISWNLKEKSLKTMYYTCETAIRSYEKVGKKLILFPYKGHNVIVFDAESNAVKEYKLNGKMILNDELLKTWFNGTVREDLCDLQEYLDVIELSTKTDSRYINTGHFVWESLSVSD